MPEAYSTAMPPPWATGASQPTHTHSHTRNPTPSHSHTPPHSHSQSVLCKLPASPPHPRRSELGHTGNSAPPLARKTTGSPAPRSRVFYQIKEDEDSLSIPCHSPHHLGGCVSTFPSPRTGVNARKQESLSASPLQ